MARSSLVMAGRGLAAAAFSAGLLALASACSAGQIAQTADTVPAVPGINVQAPVPGGQLAIRNALVVYPGAQGYPAGGTAPLALRIVNESPRAIRLTGASSPDGRVVLASTASSSTPPPPAAPSTAAPAASRSASPAPTGSARPSNSASPRPSASGAPVNPTSAPPTPAAPASVSLEIPPRGLVILDATAPQRLQLVGLTRPVRPGESIRLTLAFDAAMLADLTVPVGVPSSPASRMPAAPKPDGREE